MGEAVKGTRRAYSVGNLMLYIQPLLLVNDGSEHSSAINGIIGYWGNSAGKASVTEKTGFDLTADTAGKFTFRMPDVSYGKNINVYILSTELE